MFAKGPQPGYSPQSEAIAICPTAVCKRKSAMGISGFVVYRVKGGEALSAARTAKEAWEKALSKLQHEQPAAVKESDSDGGGES